MPEVPLKIMITDDEHHLPYSKGLMAMSIMATGLPPDQAYNIASMIHERLRDEGSAKVTMDHVRRTAERIMERQVGPKYVENYKKWQSLSKLDKPIIILMGGATGVGKSTVATILASRLGITRQVSTDIIREVMRSLLSPELVPSLFNSSFEASKALRIPMPPETDKVIVGFLEQAAMVWVGVRALIERAIVERTNFIVEGAHVVPGIIEPQFFKDAIVVHMVLEVDKPSEHRSHFEMREVETESARPFDRYLDSFENIRKIQDYVIGLAEKLQVPVFPNSSMDATVGAILEFIINQVFVEYTAGKAKEGMVEKALEISTSREAVSDSGGRFT